MAWLDIGDGYGWFWWMRPDTEIFHCTQHHYTPEDPGLSLILRGLLGRVQTCPREFARKNATFPTVSVT
jgi:hypothetical protein